MIRASQRFSSQFCYVLGTTVTTACRSFSRFSITSSFLRFLILTGSFASKMLSVVQEASRKQTGQFLHPPARCVQPYRFTEFNYFFTFIHNTKTVVVFAMGVSDQCRLRLP
jgi:hypothetical protein